MIGASPRKPTAGAFAGLGDLPGMQDVRADIPLHTLSIDLRCSSPPPVFHPEPLADLDDRKVLRQPPSRLGTMTPQSLEFGRALGERLVRSGQVKRKAESDFQLTQAFHALDILQDDRSNLAALVQGIARGADGFSLDAAESVGRNLTRKLGGRSLSTTDRDTVVSAVMEAALAQPENADAMAGLLRGMGHALTGTLSVLDAPLLAAAFEQAAQRSVDPVMNHSQLPPHRSAFAQRHGPMRVVVAMVQGSDQAGPHLEWLVRALMGRVSAGSASGLTAEDIRRAAMVLQALRYSLGEIHRDPALSDAAITAVACHVAHSRLNPYLLGQSLAKLLDSPGRLDAQAVHVTTLVRQSVLGERQLGYLIWGLLGASLPDPASSPPASGEAVREEGKAVLAKAGGVPQEPSGDDRQPSAGARAFHRLTGMSPLLAPRHLGRAIYALALSTGDAGHWGPSRPPMQSDLVGPLLLACVNTDDARRIALMAGMRYATRRLEQARPAFAVEATSLQVRATGLRALMAGDLLAVQTGMMLAEKPALVLTHPRLSTTHRVELLDLALNLGAANSAAVVTGLADRLLARDCDEGLRALGLGRLVSRALPLLMPTQRSAACIHLTQYLARIDAAAAKSQAPGQQESLARILADARQARRWLAMLGAGQAPADGKKAAAQAGVR